MIPFLQSFIHLFIHSFTSLLSYHSPPPFSFLFRFASPPSQFILDCFENFTFVLWTFVLAVFFVTIVGLPSIPQKVSDWTLPAMLLPVAVKKHFAVLYHSVLMGHFYHECKVGVNLPTLKELLANIQAAGNHSSFPHDKTNQKSNPGQSSAPQGDPCAADSRSLACSLSFSLSLSIYPSLCDFSVCLSISLSVYLYLSISVSLSLFRSLYVSLIHTLIHTATQPPPPPTHMNRQTCIAAHQTHTQSHTIIREWCPASIPHPVASCLCSRSGIPMPS